EQAQHVREAAVVALVVIDRRFQDRLTMLGDVHEDERQDPDREHRQRHAQAVVHELDAPDGQADIDGKARYRAEAYCLAEAARWVLTGRLELGIPNIYHSGRDLRRRRVSAAIFARIKPCTSPPRPTTPCER